MMQTGGFIMASKRCREEKSISINITNSSSGQETPPSTSRHNYSDGLIEFIIKAISVMLIQLLK